MLLCVAGTASELPDAAGASAASFIYLFIFLSRLTSIQGEPYVDDITMITICHVHPAHWSRLGGPSLIRHPVESEAAEG